VMCDSIASCAASDYLTDQQKSFFWENGYLQIPNFLSFDDVNEMRDKAISLVENADMSLHPRLKFSKLQAIEDAVGNYFFESIDNISFFWENSAFGEDGSLKPTFKKSESILKIGHGLHKIDPLFKKHIQNERVRNIAMSLGKKKPEVTQGAYIFKQPGIGSEVPFHQDSTFIKTIPLSNLAMWYALDDATLDNGCLWFKPGSHKRGITRRFVRNDKGTHGVFVGEDPEWDWNDFVSVPVEKGTLILIHGETVHASKDNKSTKPRHAYVFHIWEGDGSVEYAKDNCLQSNTFLPL